MRVDGAEWLQTPSNPRGREGGITGETESLRLLGLMKGLSVKGKTYKIHIMSMHCSYVIATLKNIETSNVGLETESRGCRRTKGPLCEARGN